MWVLFAQVLVQLLKLQTQYETAVRPSMQQNDVGAISQSVFKSPSETAQVHVDSDRANATCSCCRLLPRQNG